MCGSSTKSRENLKAYTRNIHSLCSKNVEPFISTKKPKNYTLKITQKVDCALKK